MRLLALSLLIIVVTGCHSEPWRDQEDPEVARAVSNVAERPESATDVASLEQLLDRAKGSAAQRVIVRRLAAIGSEDAYRALLRRWELVCHCGLYYREDIDILGRIGQTGNANLLPDLEQLFDPDTGGGAFDAILAAQPGATVRERADTVWPRLGRRERRRAVRKVCESYSSDNFEWLAARFDEGDAYTRILVVKQFASALWEPAIPVLKRALEDRDPDVRATATEAFRAFKEHRETLEDVNAWEATKGEDPKVVQLLSLLESPRREVVVGAARALGALRAKSALPRLVALLERDDRELREAVHEAISRIEN